MVTSQKIKISVKVVAFSLCVILLSNHEVSSSEYAINVVSTFEEKYMGCDNQVSLLHAIDAATKIISQKSSIEEQLEVYKNFFDRAAPHYPKNGPIDRYYFSHKRKIEVNFFRDNSSGKWNSAYISFGTCSEVLKNGGALNFDNIRRAQLTFVGLYEKEGKFPDEKGNKKIYKFKVARYRYKCDIIVDFKLSNKEQSKEVYPVRFTQIYISPRELIE
ncbi:hypothetical protein VZ119_21635 [Enterobacter bugandensis]|uniref:hypothetical protein n=1 Tax=Enterobacter bugandensis TaxID=881260 RepID=UPI0020039C85|nr:hypothetical protein [Enterobacter bugandensis]MCK7082593.1 hypothetical protein [Enterobacter bugandensis]MED5645107.1 hypothetical protein [Enterobacter bugandensis]HCM9650862.1 hypothetical protein [Enterobacter bugandensis]